MLDIIENLVSTIIPVYNRPKLLLEAVESVLSQTYRPIEIIISDDGSTDDTYDTARQLSAQHPTIIKVISNKKRGPGPAREAGRQIAEGEYIQYLDSDDLLHPIKFENQVLALKNNPQHDAVYGISRLTDINGNIKSVPFKWTGKKIDALFPKLLVDRWWCTHTPLYKREICDKVGPWRDLRYSQDWEYDARIGGQNAKLLFINKIVSDHRMHPGVKQTGNAKWLLPKDRVVFFKSLFDNAFKAGVDLNSPDMKHFSRWVFYHCRKCGILGDSNASKELYDISFNSGGYYYSDFKIYGTLSKLSGWKTAGKLSGIFNKIIKKKPGSFTMKQSWIPLE